MTPGLAVDSDTAAGRFGRARGGVGGSLGGVLQRLQKPLHLVVRAGKCETDAVRLDLEDQT